MDLIVHEQIKQWRECENYSSDGIVDPKIMKEIITDQHPEDPFEVLGEKNILNQDPSSLRESTTMVPTPVQEFFKDENVFVTGANGFVGMILVEKILRSCPHLGGMFILLRDKDGETSQERFENMFRDWLFKRLKHERPQFLDKVSLICGDVTKKNLELLTEVRNKMLETVNVIFHCAANIELMGKMEPMIKTNTLGSREVFELAKEVKNLKAIIHVSTRGICFSHKVTEERIYSYMDINYKDVINCRYIQGLKLPEKCPNAYAFSKILTENMIQNEYANLPIGIVRIPVIGPTNEEPIRGWLKSPYCLSGLILGFMSGVYHIVEANANDETVDHVPVDMIANSLICCARDTYIKYSGRIKKEIPVYNLTRAGRNNLNWNTLLDICVRKSVVWPLSRIMWYPSFFFMQNDYLIRLTSTFLHHTPAYIVDWLAALFGKEVPLRKIYKEADIGRSLSRHFVYEKHLMTHERMDNVWENLCPEDKKLFNFNTEKIEWISYVNSMILGIRVYLVNDDLHNLPASRRKIKRLYYLHRVVQISFCAVLCFLMYYVVRFINITITRKV